ncbi:hypothetical protein [Actinomadura rupiterrae]|nr:hypothetical protein [Actinomadura rupiterrae]MCP2337581.1 hypothetical protein [Actinomadura rupiterrae]
MINYLVLALSLGLLVGGLGAVLPKTDLGEILAGTVVVEHRQYPLTA